MPFQFDDAGKLKDLSPEQLAEADATSEIITFTNGTLEDDTPYWAYLAVPPSRYAEFLARTTAREALVLTEYGRVLECGLEESPPEEVKEAMRLQYGFDENYIGMLVERAKAEQKEFLGQKETRRIDDIVAMLKKQQGG